METFDTLLALLQRTTDRDGWLQPLLNDPDSAVVLGSSIAVFARAGATIPHNIAQATLSDASGGSPGTSSITVKRATGSTTGTLPKGFLFRDPRGCQAVLTLDVVVIAQTTLVLPVQTLRQTELVNTEDDPEFAVDPSQLPIASSGAGGVLIAPTAVIVLTVAVGGALGVMTFTWAINNGNASAPVPTSGGSFPFAIPSTLIHVLFAAGTYDVGDVFTVNADGTVTFVGNGSGVVTQTAGVDGTTFEVVSSTQILGGAADYLSVHGEARGAFRQPNEQTAPYRARVRNIPDAVTPVAISQTVLQAVQQLGLPPAKILEPFALGETPALLTRLAWGSFGSPAFDVGDFFDDPGVPLIMLDRRTATAYFEVNLQDYVTDPGGLEMFFDDGSYFDDPVLGFAEDSSVLPPPVLSALLALVQDIYQKHGGGVNFDVFLFGDTTVIGEGSSSANVATKVFDLAPSGGKIWYVDAGFAGHDCSSIVHAAAVSHFIVFDLEDGSHLTTATYHAQDTQRLRAPDLPTQRVTGIHGWVTSDGTGVGNLVAWFLVRSVST